MPGEYILTFPGAYHSGFSTGLNIGEAVNFVSNSWVDHGFKCQEIYRKSREKIPVFPMEWVLMENIRNIDTINIDGQTKLKMRDQFRKVWKEEKKAREYIEKIAKGHNEFANITFRLMEKRDEVPEDAHQCFYCTDFAYMSMINCKYHKINYCLYH